MGRLLEQPTPAVGNDGSCPVVLLIGVVTFVEVAALVVGLDLWSRAELLEAVDADLDGGVPRLQRSHGPRETLLHPSVELIEPPVDLVEEEPGGSGIHGATENRLSLVPIVRATGLDCSHITGFKQIGYKISGRSNSEGRKN